MEISSEWPESVELEGTLWFLDSDRGKYAIYKCKKFQGQHISVYPSDTASHASWETGNGKNIHIWPHYGWSDFINQENLNLSFNKKFRPQAEAWWDGDGDKLKTLIVPISKAVRDKKNKAAQVSATVNSAASAKLAGKTKHDSSAFDKAVASAAKKGPYVSDHAKAVQKLKWILARKKTAPVFEASGERLFEWESIKYVFPVGQKPSYTRRQTGGKTDYTITSEIVTMVN